MSKGNKLAGPFDLNRDGKMSMTEHYIAYKTFEEMSKPSLYMPRPRKEHWWNKSIEFGPIGNVIASFFAMIAVQLPFIVPQIEFFEQLQEELEKKRLYSLLHSYRYAHSDTTSLYIVIIFVGLIQLALFCATAYGCYDSIQKCREYRREKRRRKNEEYYDE